MKISNINKAIIGSVVTGITALAIIFAGNKTVTMDTVLDQHYNTVTVSGSGTATDWLDLDGNGFTVQCLKLAGNYIHAFNMRVEDCASHGVYITGKHIVFEKSIVTHTVTENGNGPCLGTGSWGSAVKAYLGSDDVIIRENVVEENCGEGIGVTRATNVTVTGNTVRDNYSVNIYIDNSPFAKALNNISICTNAKYYRSQQPASGILLGIESYSGWGNQMHDVLIDGNLVERCRPIRLYTEVAGGVQNVTISNNVFSGVTQPFVNVAGAAISNNVAGPTLPTVTPVPSVTRTPAPSATHTARPTTTWTAVPSATWTSIPTATRTLTPSPTLIPTDAYECILFVEHGQVVCLP